jgi:surfeit locus 1 family protein
VPNPTVLLRFLRPRWILFHLLVLGGVVLMVNLGFWQLQRLDERRDFNDTVSARIDGEPTLLATIVPRGSDVEPGDVEWQPVLAAGAYLAEEQVVVVNRSQDGVAGQNVVTPLRLDDGRVLLVNRGFVPLTTEVPPPPEGPVTVRGLLRASQERGFGGARDPAEGRITEVQRIDIPRLEAQLPGEVVPMWLSLQASDPPEGSLPIPLPRPELSSGPHLSYAVQWFVFAVCAVIGWVFAVRRSLRSYRADTVSEPAAGETPAPTSDGTAR